MKELVYGYITHSKLLSLEYMLDGYSEVIDQEIFQWHPEVCIVYRDGSRWKVYYDKNSVLIGQAKCKEVFIEENLRVKVLDKMQELIEMADLYYKILNAKDYLTPDIIDDFMNFMKSFIQYYTFSNEFIFEGVEKDILDKLHIDYSENIPNKMISYDNESMNVGGLLEHRGKIDYVKLLDMKDCDLVVAIDRLRTLRYKMREKMVSLNQAFYALVKKELKLLYGTMLEDEEIDEIVCNIKREEIDNISTIDINRVKIRNIKGIFCIKGNIYIIDGENRYKFLEGESSNRSEYQGVSIFGEGVVRGIARKRLHSECKDNDIYVTSCLHPKDVVLLEGIKTILVDEGGILSHATIIARELKIPCITNLGNLSDCVHEGDCLEINLYTGRVKILNSKSTFSNKNVVQIDEIRNNEGAIDRYGNKCVNLCKYLSTNNVIPGLVIDSSVVKKIAISRKKGYNFRLNETDERKIRELFPIIVRSSCNAEDHDNFTSAGLFESIKDINTLEEFYNGIQFIYDSSESHIVKMYLEKIGNKYINNIKIAVLVQKYIEFDYMITVLVDGELIKFDITESGGNRWNIIDVEKKELIGCNNLFLKKIWEEIKNVVALEKECLLELGIKKQVIFLLQVRKYGGRQNDEN